MFLSIYRRALRSGQRKATRKIIEECKKQNNEKKQDKYVANNIKKTNVYDKPIYKPKKYNDIPLL